MSVSANRTKILQAASDLFLQGGLQALSVRAIAKLAGVSTIGIYSHFEGKQGILDALYIEGFEKVAAAMDVDEQASLGSSARVLAACQNYWAVAEQYSAHYQLIFGAADNNYTPSPEAQAVAARAFKGLLELAAQTLPNTADPHEIQMHAIKVWAIVHGFVGLKNHAIADELNVVDWRSLALDAVVESLNSQTL